MDNEEEVECEQWEKDWEKDIRERQRRSWENGRHWFVVPGERVTYVEEKTGRVHTDGISTVVPIHWGSGFRMRVGD